MAKRSIINVNITASKEYAFIDHIKGGNQFGGAGQTQWKTGTTWPQNIDANGWPTYSSTTRQAAAGGIYIPASSDFAGPYTIDGRGSGRVSFSSGTWTLGAASGVTQVVNGTYDVVDSGSGWTAQLTYTGSFQTGGIGVNIPRNDPSATGAYLRDIRFYRTEDAADLAAGKIYRTAWKQIHADLNPLAIRFMNWTGCNGARNCRFENRTKPSHAQWSANQYNWVASPPYGETTGTNQYSLAAVTGTPASMLHGELATCRIGTGVARGGSITVTAISKANPGVVTATAHGFQTGDTIIHPLVSGMTQIDYLPVTITVIDPDSYSIGIDTTSFGTFSGTCRAEQFLTLQVGSGNDRIAYPMTYPDGVTTAARFGSAYVATGDYKTFIFDKTSASYKDSNGDWVYGTWMFVDIGSDYGHAGGTPLEVCTALVNELMEMTRSDGQPVDPIHMWICIPHLGLLSMDPDYSEASNFALGSVDVCLNGANGYTGLDSRCNLWLEYSNETWNSANFSFVQCAYLMRQGFLRWSVSTGDKASMCMLRSMLMVDDILAGGFSRSRLKFIIAGQGTLGVNGSSTLNDLRINGTTQLLTDPLNPEGVTPISVHDSFAWANYFFASSAFETANLATLVASWVSHADDLAAREADCAAYISGVVSAGQEAMDRYGDVLLPAYNDRMAALGKTGMGYEGGWDRSVTNGSADQNAFLQACKRSRAWANARRDYMNKFDAQPAIEAPAGYILLDQRWGDISPDPYAFSINGVEWSGVALGWTFEALRNQGKRQILVRTT